MQSTNSTTPTALPKPIFMRVMPKLYWNVTSVWVVLDGPPPVNGIRPSPEAVAAHFEFASVAEMKTAAECARDADIDAEVEARLEREALEADGELEPEAGL